VVKDEALRLAQALNNRQECEDEAADELRRLHAENALLHERHHFDNGVIKELLEALKVLNAQQSPLPDSNVCIAIAALDAALAQQEPPECRVVVSGGGGGTGKETRLVDYNAPVSATQREQTVPKEWRELVQQLVACHADDTCPAVEWAKDMLKQEEPIAQWEDPRVQAVYEVLVSFDPPPPEQHWEGWTARRIVECLNELAQQEQSPESVRSADHALAKSTRAGREVLKQCECGERAASECDEPWGPECNLGHNEKYARKAVLTPEQQAQIDDALKEKNHMTPKPTMYLRFVERKEEVPSGIPGFVTATLRTVRILQQFWEHPDGLPLEPGFLGIRGEWRDVPQVLHGQKEEKK
jgi:hypothetical protein